MAYSRVVLEGDGTTTQFSVNFALDYLLEADVTCRVGTEVDGGGNPSYRAITFLSTNLLQIAGTPAGDGVPVVFTRTLEKDELRVDFSNGDQLDEDNLTIAQKQMIMLVHEVLDGRFAAFTQDLDAGGFTLTNVREPVAAGDLTTKAYVDANNGSTSAAAAEAAAAAAAASQATAAVNSADAFDAANAAGASASAAAASAAAALASKNAVDASIDDFDDVYLGRYSSDPTLDNDGDPLQEGQLYYNDVENVIHVYNGTTWSPISGAGPADGTVVADSLTDDPTELEAIRDKLGLTIAAPVSLTELLLALAMSEGSSTLTAVGYAVADGFKSLGNVDVAGATALDTSEAGHLKVGLSYGADLTTSVATIASGEASSDPAHDMGNAFDNTSASWFSSELGAATAGVSYIGQDFGASVTKRIRRVTVLQTFGPNTSTTGVSVQYHNGTTWVTAASATVAFNVKATIDFADVGTWRYWRVLNTAGVASGNSWALNEVEMFEGSTGNLTVASQLLPVASQPSAISAALRVVPTEALTLNTDIFVDVSRDGTTWTQATLALSFTDGGTSVLTTNLVDVSGQPAGITPRWRVRSGVTPKNYKVDGVALGFVA